MDTSHTWHNAGHLQEQNLSSFMTQVSSSQGQVRQRYELNGRMPRNWTSEKYSPMTFWSGVPVRHQR